jgi:hypothetical protein
VASPYPSAEPTIAASPPQPSTGTAHRGTRFSRAEPSATKAPAPSSQARLGSPKYAHGAARVSSYALYPSDARVSTVSTNASSRRRRRIANTPRISSGQSR